MKTLIIIHDIIIIHMINNMCRQVSGKYVRIIKQVSWVVPRKGGTFAVITAAEGIMNL